MHYVFDIDGVVCSNTHGKYCTAQPKQDVINRINKLFDRGNHIVFHTARGWKMCNGDLSKIKEMWYDFTINQLNGWGIRFNELVMGKPYGQIYIDDLGFKFEKAEDLDKFLEHV